MAENMIEELIMEEIDIKEEEVFIKEEICSSSSLEETWDVHEEIVKMENTQSKGKDKIKQILYSLNRF